MNIKSIPVVTDLSARENIALPLQAAARRMS